MYPAAGEGVQREHFAHDRVLGEMLLPLRLFGQILGRVDRLLHRHLLEQRDQVHRRLGGAQHGHHVVGLGLDRTDLRQAADLGRDVQEAGDASGRRGVEDHRVVGRTVLHPSYDGFLDLAGQEHVLHARRDRRGEVDGAHAAQGAGRDAGRRQLVEHVQVVEQRGLGVDGERVDVTAVGSDRDLALLVGQRRGVEQLGDALPPLGLDEEHGTAVGGKGTFTSLNPGRSVVNCSETIPSWRTLIHACSSCAASITTDATSPGA